MTARDRVRATRATLAATTLLAALLWGAAVALLLAAMAGAADWATALPFGARAVALPASLAAGGIVALAVLWRGRRVRSLETVALWVEERVPTLRYALVTSLEPRWASAAPALEREIQRVSWRAPLARAAARMVALPGGVLLVALALGFALPRGIVHRIGAPRSGDALEHPATGVSPSGDRLSPLLAIVTPPTYVGRPATTIENPSVIVGLAASGVRIEGRGTPAGISASVGDDALEVSGTGGRWRVVFAMPARPSVVRLRDGNAERLVLLEPRPDSAPVVVLVTPARDTVLREPKGSVTLSARAVDDIGLASLWLEYIVSSGEGESFTFRSGIVRRAVANGARSHTLDAPLSLDSLALQPGDIVHVRAVAVDGNTATGPDTGVSETRSMRVPRASEYDSLAVEGAAPAEVDKSELSQRMLIQLAEALQRKRRSLPRATVVSESRAIASDQARLRRRVGDIIFTRLGEDNSAEDEGHDTDTRAAMTPEELLKAADEATAAAGAHKLDFDGDETPVVAVNRPLLEAYNAMWEAGRELELGEPGAALPHMYAALAAIQRARQAERIYLRGRPTEVIVDLAKVRLVGKLADVDASARTPRVATDDARQWTARLDAALALVRLRPDAAVDSLLLLRMDALEHSPALAARLREAIDAIRAGGDATNALALARQTVVGAPAVRTAAPAWGGAW